MTSCSLVTTTKVAVTEVAVTEVAAAKVAVTEVAAAKVAVTEVAAAELAVTKATPIHGNRNNVQVFGAMEEENKEEITERLQDVKAKTRKGNIILKKREEGEHQESSKNCLFICGNRRTDMLKNFMQDIYMLQKPFTCYMPKLHHNLVNIEDKIETIVDICIHNSCSLFFTISSTKKKPSRFIIGRLYNNKILDYYIFSLLSFIPMHMFPLSKEILLGSKPIVLIQGSYFEQSEVTKYMRNVLFDMFKHKNVETLTKGSIQRLVVITAYEARVSTAMGGNGEKGSSDAGVKDAYQNGEVNGHGNSSRGNSLGKGIYVMSFRQYLLKKEMFNLTEKEIPTLDEIGPRFEFTLEDSKIPEYALFQEAIKKVDVEKKVKSNKVKVDEFGHNIKRVYVQKQNFSKLHTKHSKLMKKSKKLSGRNG
ncbi:nucleolar preribosomal assembly protein, putative [Plasmodium ovale curtisi]|uniref:Ribosome production factor 2 homolog n=1 Tax=Plasmodium ovale curtisi TaxID=864141 RepID=A0A1A8VUL7_PLAOA|nr:nucleolar preribosomal assembly protein, putative [Plasmodium ovale curtisi]